MRMWLQMQVKVKNYEYLKNNNIAAYIKPLNYEQSKTKMGCKKNDLKFH